MSTTLETPMLSRTWYLMRRVEPDRCCDASRSGLGGWARSKSELFTVKGHWKGRTIHHEASARDFLRKKRSRRPPFACRSCQQTLFRRLCKPFLRRHGCHGWSRFPGLHLSARRARARRSHPGRGLEAFGFRASARPPKSRKVQTAAREFRV